MAGAVQLDDLPSNAVPTNDLPDHLASAATGEGAFDAQGNPMANAHFGPVPKPRPPQGILARAKAGWDSMVDPAAPAPRNPREIIEQAGKPAAGNEIARTLGAGMRAAGGAVAGAAEDVGVSPTMANRLERDIPMVAASAGAVSGGAPANPIAPKAMSPAQMLMSEGVRITPGQMAGGAFRATENKATSIPLTGDAIISAQRRSIEDFNKAGYNRALAPISEKFSGGKAGYEGIKEVGEKLGKAYDKVLSKVNFTKDGGFDSDLAKIQSGVKEMPPDQAGQFQAILENRIAKRLEPDGTMTGEKFKQVQSELTQKASGFHRSPDAAVRELGDKIDDLNAALRANLERTNPEYADEISAANRGWAMFARLRRAAANRSTSGGVFTPGDLLSAAKMGDNTPGRGGFARGEALMQDLAWAGQQVLPNTYPESGTAGRMLLAGGALGAAEMLHHPEMLAALGIGALPYTSPMISGLNRLAGPRAAAAAASPRVSAALLAAPGLLSAGTPEDTLNQLGSPP